MLNLNRRRFIQSSASIAGVGALAGLSNPAMAANTSGYKALVCVFLYGGMDHADTILPYDQANYDALASLRQGLFDTYEVGAGNSSRDRENLLELTIENSSDFPDRQFAVPAELAELRELFNNKEMAIVGNVGPLLEPTDRHGFEDETVSLPKRLFSHNDQQSTWMSLGVEGSRIGWGGGGLLMP